MISDPNIAIIKDFVSCYPILCKVFIVILSKYAFHDSRIIFTEIIINYRFTSRTSLKTKFPTHIYASVYKKKSEYMK